MENSLQTFTEEQLSLLQLSLVPGIGPAAIKNWITEYGSAAEFYQNIASQKHKIKPNIYFQLEQSKGLVEAIDLEKIHRELTIQTCFWGEENYPKQLLGIQQSPVILYYKGKLETLDSPIVLAIVGTRKPSNHKIAWLKEFISDLKYLLGDDGFVVVSGMAHGIDVTAHSFCADLGIRNFGIFAHGLEQVYPKNHAPLAQKLIHDGGGLVSEHPAYTKMHPDLFPKRNRIIAGICHAVLVVESNIKGGSMVTASIGNHLGRDVFAVPGRPQDLSNAGCNYLIQKNMAFLCHNAADLVQQLAPHLIPTKPLGSFQTAKLLPQKTHPELSDQQLRILDQMQQGYTQFDQLLLLTQITSAQLSAELTQLEILGLIASEKHQQFSVC